MDRRDSLKAMLIGTLGGSALLTSSCKPEEIVEEVPNATKLYGRTAAEILHDEKINSTIFLNDHELGTIAVLCDIILPSTATAGSATDAGVPEFIDFIVKDIPQHQLPIRGGLMWLNSESNKRFGSTFIESSNAQQIEIVDDIAYPDKAEEKPDIAHGISFFSLMTKLTLTGYYTTKIGFDDLGYKGNTPNIWDGVPPEVLSDHEVDYEPEWLAKCVDQDARETTAVWDNDMNLIS